MAVSQTAPQRPRRIAGEPGPERLEGPKPGGPAVKAAKSIAGRFDVYVDAVNRLPRPALMVLTVGLFAYAVLDPAGFAARMAALDKVPEPLWWMQGAVVTFYFGAREAHYHRQRGSKTQLPVNGAVSDEKR